ncbi:helix-turn-helix transcriptional regulator [Marivibrio halodurans]|uniref:Helix-turn-helix transcriptional regulator n=1 Tax=Marivibrio halodurans TaxID=2039722 RepID=A0A8J7RXJ5_9PROT|nr:AraC family transcriptional regulator [Marivibrio halodurans]MBP5856385.1 helix-turn-helix transcriptional regulator [Marivibrio halodurans]
MTSVKNDFQGRFARAVLFRAAHGEPPRILPYFRMVMRVAGAPVRFRLGGGMAGGDMVDLGADEVLLIDPWTPHARDPLAENTAATLLVLEMEPSWAGAPPALPVTEAPARVAREVLAPLGPETRSARDALVRSMRRDANRIPGLSRSPADAWAVEEPLCALVNSILARCLDPVEGGARSLPAGVRPIDHRIWRAIELMRRTICKEPGVDAIAVAAGLSRSRFFEQFRACCGVTPRFYADMLMIEEAARRLTEGEGSIAEISDALGFSAQSHFTRFFRHKTGASPSLFRRATRGYSTRARLSLVASGVDGGADRLAGA